MHGKAYTVDCSPARLVLGAAIKNPEDATHRDGADLRVEWKQMEVELAIQLQLVAALERQRVHQAQVLLVFLELKVELGLRPLLGFHHQGGQVVVLDELAVWNKQLSSCLLIL